ncbi:MAG: UPF0261 family protein, partial [Pararhizobium sp.]
FIDAMRLALPGSVALHEVDGHINSPQFSTKALAVFDAWVAQGIIPQGRP